MVKVVYIDAGHGGRDPGAVGNNEKEKDWTLKYSKEISKNLRGLGLEVIESRTEDKTKSLVERTNEANRLKADIFISIHLNAYTSTAQGYETYHYAKSKEGKILACKIHEKVKGYYRMDRGVKVANFHVLRESKMPAVLLELGFITNKADIDITKSKIKEISKSISEAIGGYLRVDKKEEIQEVEKEDKPSKWAEEDWEKGVEMGITDGTRPRELATREEVVSMIMRGKR